MVEFVNIIFQKSKESNSLKPILKLYTRAIEDPKSDFSKKILKKYFFLYLCTHVK